MKSLYSFFIFLFSSSLLFSAPPYPPDGVCYSYSTGIGSFVDSSQTSYLVDDFYSVNTWTYRLITRVSPFGNNYAFYFIDYSYNISNPIVCNNGDVLDADCQCVAPPPICPINSTWDGSFCSADSGFFCLDGDCLVNSPIIDPLADFDGDGIPNGIDLDLDGDGIPNEYDDFLGDGTSNGDISGIPNEIDNCTNLESQFLSTCPIPPNKAVFSCSTINGLPYITAKRCISDFSTPNDKSPCDKEIDIMNSICDKGLDGKCIDNGLQITTNTLICIPDIKIPSADDCSVWHETFDGTNCICEIGYSRDTWNYCSKDLDANATQAQINDKEAKDEANAKEQVKSELDLNNSIRSAVSDDRTNEALAGIRRDLNKTNNKLDKLSSDNNTTNSLLEDIYNLFIPAESTQAEINNYNDGVNAISSLTTTFNNIKLDYENLSTTVGDGFSASPVSSGVSPNFRVLFHGTYIDFDLCSAFSNFYSIFYFIFTMIFTYVGIRFFIFGFSLGLK